MGQEKQIYSYEKTQVNLAGAILFTMIFAGGFFYQAMSNRAGIKVLFFTLGVKTATTFYWCMALLFVTGLILIVIQRTYGSKEISRVELHTAFADLPKASLFGGQIKMPYTTISNISRKIVHDRELLSVSSSVGNARLLSSDFMSVSDYGCFISEITSRVRLAQQLAAANKI